MSYLEDDWQNAAYYDTTYEQALAQVASGEVWDDPAQYSDEDEYLDHE